VRESTIQLLHMVLVSMEGKGEFVNTTHTHAHTHHLFSNFAKRIAL